jgi:hypothetical protein
LNDPCRERRCHLCPKPDASFLRQDPGRPATQILDAGAQDYSAAEIKRGLADYTGIGKYAPKPIDIAELIKNNRETDRRADNKPRELPPIREADEATAKAWQYVIKLWGLNLFNVGKVDSETAEAYILLCNRQAKGNNNPTSIPPEAWRADVWGCEREAMV